MAVLDLLLFPDSMNWALDSEQGSRLVPYLLLKSGNMQG